MTPEGKIKALVKSVLDRYQGRIYYNMPVPSGYGSPMLDFVGSFHGLFWVVETKAPGEVPTPRQLGTIEKMRAGGAAVFVVDGPRSLAPFTFWLEAVEKAFTKLPLQ